MDETENGMMLPMVAEQRLPQKDFRAGTAALAEMPEGEFRQRLAAMERGRERLKAIHQELMHPDTDYGVIPGTGKPTLLKAGAEKLLHFYRMACEFVPVVTHGDGESLPWITVVTECRLHVGDLEGPVVNTGHGAANSWEKRYRRGGGDVAAAHDMLNTLIKMSAKRAMVDATLRATATSGVYSQDMEDLTAPPAAPLAAQGGKPGARPAKAGGRPASRRTAPGERSGCYCAEIPGGDTSDPMICGWCEKNPSVVVCAEGGCGLILSADEIKAAARYAEAFEGETFCTAHGREMLAIWKAKQAPAGGEAEDPFVDQ